MPEEVGKHNVNTNTRVGGSFTQGEEVCNERSSCRPKLREITALATSSALALSLSLLLFVRSSLSLCFLVYFAEKCSHLAESRVFPRRAKTLLQPAKQPHWRTRPFASTNPFRAAQQKKTHTQHNDADRLPFFVFVVVSLTWSCLLPRLRTARSCVQRPTDVAWNENDTSTEPPGITVPVC